jgi:hypothetical protein
VLGRKHSTSDSKVIGHIISHKHQSTIHYKTQRTWAELTPAFSRLQRGDIGRLSTFSRSPCLYISSSRRSTHILWMGNGVQLCTKSAIFNAICVLPQYHGRRDSGLYQESQVGEQGNSIRMSHQEQTHATAHACGLFFALHRTTRILVSVLNDDDPLNLARNHGNHSDNQVKVRSAIQDKVETCSLW